ncbi:MAG TPA: glycosyltransferase family 1 protein [Candidatus Desulfofervidus auxilii]|uniref:Glycosyltransferase family 1 protein n=1 Tax=Desulfofervidus auxilii TaxID=1621989 RepID=A0A7C0Y7Z8_DESA2|nr:glycosyltransferase family 1 protein [Candidatus Desulfofervidus auxilii]
MKISILTPDLSHNCLGRAYLLAKILQRHYEVEIVGPVFGDEIWKPVANDKSMTYKSVKICGMFKPYWQIKELIKKIEGDVIYASKPLFTSFGIGLLKKLFDSKPLVLDIDDWQMGFMKESYKNLSIARRLKFLVASVLRFYSVGSYWNNLLGEKLSRLADKITVSNSFLQYKFGGTIVWHARNTEIFDPAKFDKYLLREKYQIEKTNKVVMFFGTPRPHKGIEDLVKAVSLIKDRNVIIVVVGIDNKDLYCKNLVSSAKEILGDRFKGFGLQSFEKVPEFLSMADVVVIPQKRNFSTIGQVPAKVFDAMAMAKPIITTNVSDLPEILDGCGWIVEPENPKQLAETIQYVLNNPEKAEEMGWKARQKCIEKYSWDAMEKVLLEVFEKYE